MKLLNVYLLYSGTLYIETSNCLMSTYFTGMLLVYIFLGILSFVLIHYMNVLLLYFLKKMQAIISNRKCYVVSLLRLG